MLKMLLLRNMRFEGDLVDQLFSKILYKEYRCKDSGGV
jgi:hypothetical protein